MLKTVLTNWTKPLLRNLIIKGGWQLSLFLSASLMLLSSCDGGSGKKATTGITPLGTSVSTKNCGNNRTITFYRKNARTTASTPGQVTTGIKSLQAGDTINIKAQFMLQTCNINGRIALTCSEAKRVPNVQYPVFQCGSGKINFYSRNLKGVNVPKETPLSWGQIYLHERTSANGAFERSVFLRFQFPYMLYGGAQVPCFISEFWPCAWN